MILRKTFKIIMEESIVFKFNKKIQIGNRIIGEEFPTYFIAEIGGNFDGSIKKAKKLIDAAKEAGADCAKFQTFTAETIVSEGGFSKMTLHGVHGTWGKTVSEVFKDVEFPISWHREIADYSKKVGEGRYIIPNAYDNPRFIIKEYNVKESICW